MTLQRERKTKKERKSYELSQSALYLTKNKSRMAAILATTTQNLIDCIGDYRRFEIVPENDPFKLGKQSKPRQVQKPAAKLMAIHERILKLLRCVKVPEYMQFALKGTSYKKNAEAHITGKYVATLDIRNFFGSTCQSKVFNFFNGPLRAPGDIANLYARLTTIDNCLPTGSPLSPLLSFYANKKLFDDLNDIAKEYELTFTCYVDDLTFSGEHISNRFLWRVEERIRKSGHVIAANKTRVFSETMPKHITGVVIQDGGICLPYVRQRKIRLIKDAISGKAKTHGFTKKELGYKLGGLLGEAAYLDPRNLHAAIEFSKSIRIDSFKSSSKLHNYVELPKPETLDENFIPPWQE